MIYSHLAGSRPSDGMISRKTLNEPAAYVDPYGSHVRDEQYPNTKQSKQDLENQKQDQEEMA